MEQKSETSLTPLDEARAIWEFIEETIRNEQLKSDFGISGPPAALRIVVVLVAGDAIHPQRGLALDRDGGLTASHGSRKRMIDQHLAHVLRFLESGGSNESLVTLIASAFPHQVTYAVFSRDDTERAITTLQQQGLGQHPFADHRLDPIPGGLLFVFCEEYTYGPIG